MLLGQTLEAQVNVFTRVVKFLLHAGFLTWPGKRCAVAKSLAAIGFSSWHQGIGCRPILACGSQAAIALRKYLISDKGTYRDFNKHPMSFPGTPLEPPGCLKCDHDTKVPFLKQGFSHFLQRPIDPINDLTLL